MADTETVLGGEDTTAAAADDTTNNDTAANEAGEQKSAAEGADKTATDNADDKSGDDAAKSEDAKSDKDDKDAGAPDEYSDFNMPEGVEVDAALLDQFKPIAKELGLTQEQAQRLVDLQASSAKEAAERSQKAFTEQQDEWVNTAKADKEFGGDKFEESVGAARAALKAVAGDNYPKLQDALNFTGAGNHPEVIRFMVRLSKFVNEDTNESGGPNVGKRDPAEILFGKSEE